jgi:histone-lysine N-methyltransferase SETMAR
MQWEVLPRPAYSPVLASSDFHLFGPPKESLGGKRFRADDEVKLFVQRWPDKQPQALFQRDIKKLPKRWGQHIEVQGENEDKHVLLFGGKNPFNKFL